MDCTTQSNVSTCHRLIASRTDIMTLLQTIHLEHLPSSHTIHVALYRDVKNATFLQQQLLIGNTDFEYAFIDAGVVSIAAILLFLASLMPDFSASASASRDGQRH